MFPNNFHAKLYPQIPNVGERKEYSLSKRYIHYQVKLICWTITVIALMMEAVSSSETSVNIYQTTRGNTPEGNHLRL
jgi:hypothetical protein